MRTLTNKTSNCHIIYSMIYKIKRIKIKITICKVIFPYSSVIVLYNIKYQVYCVTIF